MIVKDPCSVKVYQWWLKDGQEEVKHTTINKMTCSMLWNNMNVSILTKFHINKDALWLLVSQVLRFSDHRLAHSVPCLLLASSTGICVSAMDVLPFCLSLIKWNSEMSPVWFIHYYSCIYSSSDPALIQSWMLAE